MTLSWQGCVNARDLGGLSTTDGGRIRAGRLIRSDNHDRLTSEGVDAVLALAPARVLDLRWLSETRRHPSPFADQTFYRNVALIADNGRRAVEETADYRAVLDANGVSIADAVTALAQAPPGPVVMHCHAGRDRTGLLAAIVLAAVGVPTRLIAADYARSPQADPGRIIAALRHVDHRHGGVGGYLTDAGMSPTTVPRLRARLVD